MSAKDKRVAVRTRRFNKAGKPPGRVYLLEPRDAKDWVERGWADWATKDEGDSARAVVAAGSSR